MINQLWTIFLGKMGFKAHIMLLLLTFCCACNTSRYLPAEKTFLSKNEIRFSKGEKVEHKSKLKAELETLYKQRENTTLKPFGVNRRWFYYKTINKKQTRFNKWLRKLLAETPTIFDAELAANTALSMKYFLQNKGYLNADVFYDKNVKNDSNTEVFYYVSPKALFKIDTTAYVTKDTIFQRIIQNNRAYSFLKKGNPLSEANYNQEVNRITKLIRNEGYAGFFVNYIKPLEYDTVGTKARLRFEILPPNNAVLHKKSYIGEIYVVFSDVLNPDIQGINDTIIDNVHFVGLGDLQNKVSPSALLDRLYFHKNDEYEQEAIDRSYTRFDNMRLFRFINVKQQIDSLNAQKIHFQINVSPYRKMELNGALELNYLSSTASIGSLFGGGVSFAFRNKNLKGGGEILSSSLEFNTQLLTSVRPVEFYSYDGKFQTDLLLPRFNDFYFRGLGRALDKEIYRLDKKGENRQIFRFYTNLKDNASTKFSFIVNPFFSRDLVFNRIGVSYGFTLPINQESNLSFNHIGLDYFDPNRPENSKIEKILFNNIFRSQLSAGFILKDISYQKNKQNVLNNNYQNLRIGIEFSGVELYGINALYNVIAKKQGAFKILGSKVDYGRYVRLETEWSEGISLGGQYSFHYRLKGGIAKTFGYDGSVPFARQFFVGGAGSIRGWNWRELGAGATNLSQSSGTVFFQSGDVQLESNAEIRFPLFWIFKLAAFVDVGNVWNINNRTSDETTFNKNFYKQLAVGSGLGVRMDFGFALLRLDIGSKIRTPYTNPVTNNHFYYSKYQPFEFRKLVYNLALGYPF